MLDIIINNRSTREVPITKEELQKAIQECRSKFPKEKYQVIYADPPWNYKTMNVQGEPSYPCMNLKELKELPVHNISQKDCVLLLWTTGPKLPEALELISSWGFRYKTIIKYWRKVDRNNKPICGLGWWTRSSMELLLVATKGHPLRWKKTKKLPQECSEPRRKHSEKPSSIREEIVSFFGKRKRVELFSRHCTPHFDSWGLEIPGYFYTPNKKRKSEDIEDGCNNPVQPCKRKPNTRACSRSVET